MDFLSQCGSAITDSKLSDLVASHREETRVQLERLRELDSSTPEPSQFAAARSLMSNCIDVASDDQSQPEVIDAAVLSGIQSLKHLEIAKYGSLRSFCEDLGRTEAADALTRSFEEDARFDRALSRLAERYINFRSVKIASSDCRGISGRAPSALSPPFLAMFGFQAATIPR